MPVPFFDLKRQYKEIGEEINSAIKAVEESSQFILGENVSSLEKEIASFSGAKYGVGVASGTDALHLSLRALGIGPGDEVLTPPFTFVATIEAICYTGAVPVFADIDPKTFNIDPSKLKKKITKKTKAVLPVHLFGQAAEMGEIVKIAKEHSLKIVEDSAQAIGAEYKGRKVNSFGDAGCLSFFPTKNLGCFGDGGMVVTSDEKIAERLKVLRGHGSKAAYHYDILGFNSRLDEIQAAILRVKLKYLGKWTEKRRENAALYSELLKDIAEAKTPEEINGKHVFNQYTIRAKRRDDLFSHLKSKGIGAMIYYPLSLHSQKAYEYLGYKQGDFVESEKAEKEVISLPIFPELTEEEIKEVVSAIRSFY